MSALHTLLIRRLIACGLTLAMGTAAAGMLLLLAARPAQQAEAVNSEIVYPGCAPTIQACLNGAAPGQTVLIQAGTYITSLTLSKAVSLTGVGSAQVTLQALTNQRVLTVTGGTIKNTVVISGLTMANGYALGAACPVGCGGGMAVLSNAMPLVENVVFTNNWADHFGGGLYADTDSHLTLKDVRLISNSAVVNGGGAYLYAVARVTRGEFRDNRSDGNGGGLVASYLLALTGTQFFSNTAIGDGGGLYTLGDAWLTGAWFQNNQSQRGGGLFATTQVTLDGTEFHDNFSDQGGGIYAQGPLSLNGGLFQGNHSGTGGGLFAGSTLALVGTQFLTNTATAAGGGLYAEAVAVFSGGQFSHNHCDDPGCRGGGLFAGAGLTVAATEFRGNSASQGGGLWHLAGPGRVANSLFAGNSVSDTGAALYLNSTGNMQIVETTIASPTVGAHAAIYVAAGTVNITDTIVASYSVGISQTAGSVSEDYGLFAGNDTNIAGSVATGVHQVPGDPKFANLNGGNYHLTVGSPAIDGGTDAGQKFDFEGDPRPIGAGFDIGYDEFGHVLHLPFMAR